MKTLLMFITMLCSTASFAACSSEAEAPRNAEGNAAEASVKTLVVYYSYTNNCETVVNDLRTQISCDVLEIEPKEKGLKYEANNYAIGSEQLNKINANPNDLSSYPEIDLVDVNLSQYDCILIAVPLWWSQMATPMQSFLFQYGGQMAGKHIGMIVSSASSGISGVVSRAKELIPEGQFFEKNLWVRSSQVSNCHTLTSQWLQDIDYANLQPTTNNDSDMKMTVSDGVHTVIFQLNETSAAKALYDRLPMSVSVENYSNNEKIFYPDPALDCGSDNLEGDSPAGTLALFSPWGNIVMFYGAASRYSGLYILGAAISRADQISALTGTIQVTKGEATGISQTKTDSRTNGKAYMLNGQLAQADSRGVIIQNRKKTIRK